MFLYRLLSVLLFPLIYLYLIIRLIKGKEDRSRFKERFGFNSHKRQDGQLIFIHSVSVGESNSAISLIETILKNNPQTNILFTSTTLTSAAQINNKLKNNKRVIHQFLPIDDIFSIRRFIKYWRPDLAVFIESEIWPNLINELSKNNIKLALINARISARSAKRWSYLHQIGFNIFKHFQISFAQSEQDKKRLIDLGLKHTKFIGNLKSCAQILEFNEKELKKLSNQIKDRKLWLASSTHRGEEEIIIRIHQKLKKYYPDLLTIIAPRHPNRIDEIVKIIPKTLNFAIRSKKEVINKDIDLYLADTLGELGLFYKLSDISLIAGSLKDGIGGHNPFEALKLGSIVISGKNVINFAQIYDDLGSNNACLLAKDEKDLFSYLLKLLKDPKFRSSLRENWKKMDQDSSEILLKIVQELK